MNVEDIVAVMGGGSRGGEGQADGVVQAWALLCGWGCTTAFWVCRYMCSFRQFCMTSARTSKWMNGLNEDPAGPGRRSSGLEHLCNICPNSINRDLSTWHSRRCC